MHGFRTSCLFPAPFQSGCHIKLDVHGTVSDFCSVAEEFATKEREVQELRNAGKVRNQFQPAPEARQKSDLQTKRRCVHVE